MNDTGGLSSAPASSSSDGIVPTNTGASGLIQRRKGILGVGLGPRLLAVEVRFGAPPVVHETDAESPYLTIPKFESWINEPPMLCPVCGVLLVKGW